jgi:ABC-type Fe3+-siderophore transport system permease subunit
VPVYRGRIDEPIAVVRDDGVSGKAAGMDSATRAWWLVVIIMVVARVALLAHSLAIAGSVLFLGLVAAGMAQVLLLRRARNRR